MEKLPQMTDGEFVLWLMRLCEARGFDASLRDSIMERLQRMAACCDGSVLQPWVMKLPRRMQGVLTTAVRGQDGSLKESLAKPLGRWLRWSFMVPADPDELKFENAFMTPGPTVFYITRARDAFLRDLDQHNVHWLTHFMQAFEVVGYEHPEPVLRHFARDTYYMICERLHFNPESQDEFTKRMLTKKVRNGEYEG